MRQLQLFTTTELAAMRDQTAARSHSPQAAEFRQEHERRRAQGLRRRHAERLQHAMRVRPGPDDRNDTRRPGATERRPGRTAAASPVQRVQSGGHLPADAKQTPSDEEVRPAVAEPRRTPADSQRPTPAGPHASATEATTTRPPTGAPHPRTGARVADEGKSREPEQGTRQRSSASANRIRACRVTPAGADRAIEAEVPTRTTHESNRISQCDSTTHMPALILRMPTATHRNRQRHCLRPPSRHPSGLDAVGQECLIGRHELSILARTHPLSAPRPEHKPGVTESGSGGWSTATATAPLAGPASQRGGRPANQHDGGRPSSTMAGPTSTTAGRHHPAQPPGRPINTMAGRPTNTMAGPTTRWPGQPTRWPGQPTRWPGRPTISWTTRPWQICCSERFSP